MAFAVGLWLMKSTFTDVLLEFKITVYGLEACVARTVIKRDLGP